MLCYAYTAYKNYAKFSLMKRTLLFLIAAVILSNAGAQDSLQRKSIYKYRLGVDIPIGLLSAGFGLGGLIKYKKNKPLSVDVINALKPSDVNKFDRYAIYQHSKPAAISSDVFQYTAMVSPAFLFIDKEIRQDWKTVLPIWMETFAITTTLTMFTKEMVRRKRPYVYRDEYKGNEVGKSATASFFSGHTSITAASTYFIAMVYSDYHPHSRFKPLVWTGAAVLPALTALTRVKAGKHYWTDVITGYAVGALVGTLTPFLHRRDFRRK